jgi:transposase-like protein
MFKGRQFDRSVILLCVRWYLAYNLSLRDLEEMMAERGISVDHATSCIISPNARKFGQFASCPDCSSNCPALAELSQRS